MTVVSGHTVIREECHIPDPLLLGLESSRIPPCHEPSTFDLRLLHLKVLLGGLGDPRQLEATPALGTE